jgi:hypothetical protein
MHASLTELGFEITSMVPERAQDYTGAPRLPFNVQSTWASAERVEDSSGLAGTWITVRDAKGRERLEMRWNLESTTIRAEQPAA